MRFSFVMSRWLLIGLSACSPGSLGVGPAPLLPGANAATLGLFRGVNRAQVEKALLAQFHNLPSTSVPLELRAEYVAATQVAANALADWARNLGPSTVANEQASAVAQTRVTVVPPTDYRPSVTMTWGSVWGITLVSRAGVVPESDIKQWAALLAQLALDERWRLIAYSVGPPIQQPR
jgi:hypothetical protein